MLHCHRIITVQPTPRRLFGQGSRRMDGKGVAAAWRAARGPGVRHFSTSKRRLESSGCREVSDELSDLFLQLTLGEAIAFLGQWCASSVYN